MIRHVYRIDEPSSNAAGGSSRPWRYDADGCIPAAECYRRYSDVFGADHDVQIMGERSFGELMTEQYGEPSFNRKLGGKSTKVRRAGGPMTPGYRWLPIYRFQLLMCVMRACTER